MPEYLTFDWNPHTAELQLSAQANCPTIGINEHFNQIFYAKARSLILYAIIT